MMGTDLNDADANDVGLDDKLLFSLLRSTQVVVIPPSDMGTFMGCGWEFGWEDVDQPGSQSKPSGLDTRHRGSIRLSGKRAVRPQCNLA